MPNKSLIIGLLGLAAAFAGFVSVGFSYEEYAGLMVALLVVIPLGFIIFPKLLPRTDSRFFINLVILGFVLKIGGSLTRLVLTANVWKFQDANVYFEGGGDVAAAIYDLDLSGVIAAAQSGGTTGTAPLELFTGIIYAAIGPSLFGGFIVFGFLAFIGSLLFIKAFDLAFDGRNIRLFAIMMFFFPSLLIWPSSLGKEAILFFTAGLTSFGLVKLVNKSQIGGLVPLLIGIAGMALIRPHVSAIVVVAVCFAMLLRNPGRILGDHIKYVLVAGLIVIGAVSGYTWAGRFLELSSISLEGVAHALSKQAGNEFLSGGAGSNFATEPVDSPLWLPIGFITVLFRPFPWEAGDLLIRIQSMESILLISLILWKIKAILKHLFLAPKNPLLVFAIVSIILHFVTLSTLGNFGLLARQRSLLFPYLFILMAAQFAVDRRVDQNRLNTLQATVA